ncbi:hypothetical protein ACFHYQ_18520 [Sphaerimonospora cavernae]|uniref:Uncharacterized protein n=1 Tax=Sphaerimonospora cavernae TaxID=1740611 RepID=A0ABV6U910_9ACTN
MTTQSPRATTGGGDGAAYGKAAVTATAWLGHPVTMAAVALLILNDHLFKRLWPGVVTGKLSDFAGMLVAPPLLALLLESAILAARAVGRAVRRIPAPRLEAGKWIAAAAILLTGGLFTLMKTTAAGAEAAAAVWGLFTPSAQVIADPTDLVGLPLLAVAWLVRGRAAQGLDAYRAVRRARTLVVLPAAVFAVAATSAGPPAPSARHVEVHGSTIVVFLGSERGEGLEEGWALATSDQGRSWREWKGAPSGHRNTRACVPGEPRRCYRVVPLRLKVEQTADGGATWSTAWEISRGRQRLLDRHYENPDRYGIPSDPAASVAVAVLPVTGGHLVAVANRTDGVVLRDVAERWHRFGFVDYGSGLSERAAVPLAEPGERTGSEIKAAGMAALAVLLVTLGFAGGARRRPAWFVLSGLTMWSGALLIAMSGRDIADMMSAGAGILLMLLGGTGVLIVYTLSQPLRGVPALVAAPLTFAAIYLPFLGWSAGWPDDYGVAVLLAIALCVAVLALGVRLMKRAWRDDSP